jgi:hypothetical protein
MKMPQTDNTGKVWTVNLLKSGKIITLMLISFMMTGLVVTAQPPPDPDTVITVRFSNPNYDCETFTYCLDVDFRANPEAGDQTIFGVNVRFFYDDMELEFIAIGDTAQGYGLEQPIPPTVQTGPGTAFDFPIGHDADFVNANVELKRPGENPPTISSSWTKLFNVCFTVAESYRDIPEFCPPVVWDMDVDPAFGGFGNNSNGVVVTVVGATEQSRPVTENVEQFNWTYYGELTPPFGYPDPTICIPTTCFTQDMGDAPEGALAYPEAAVLGKFPTCLDPTLAGYIQHGLVDPPAAFFGPSVDSEADGNAGACSPYTPYNFDECFADGDAGLLIPASPFTIVGSSYLGCIGPGAKLCMVGDTIIWGTDLDIDVTNNTQQDVFVNVLIDWNRNGMWDFDPTTKVGPQVIPEHCLVNFPVPPGSGSLSILAPPPIYAGPYQGYVWARFSITERPVLMNRPFAPDWDGSGEFLLGETEDYLFLVDPRKEIPVSGWALALGIFLIAAFTIFRLRKS